VGDYIQAAKKSVDRIGETQLAALEMHMRATAARLDTKPISVQLAADEKKAAKIVPKQTAKVKMNGYGGTRELLTPILASMREKFPFDMRKIGSASELQTLIDGKRSVLDIRNLLDAQYERKSELRDVLNYLEILKAAGLIEM
jgi:hypothetical protein